MRQRQMKTVGSTLAAMAVAGAAGYFWAQWTYQPKLVEIVQTACGIPASTARFALPLETAMRAGGQLPFAVGPVEMPDGGGLVVLRFDPTAEGKARSVRMIDEVLVLPTVHGRDARLPERITVTCRDGMIASVRYQTGRRGGSTFTVERERTASLVEHETESAATAPGAPVSDAD